MTRTNRPAGVEWPATWPETLTDIPHGSPLLIGGRLQAALRDASWWNHPDTTKPKYVHIVIASSVLGAAAACDPAWIMLDVDGLCKDAASFAGHVRCRRRACAALFALADNAARNPGSMTRGDRH